MQPRSQFCPLMLDFEEYSAVGQAEQILERVREYQLQGYEQVGIIYSANHDQAKTINSSYQRGHWRTWTAGGNQAAVMEAVEQRLANLRYSALQEVFRILPITTCAQAGGIGPVKQNWLDEDLGYIGKFLEQKGRIVLGWQNQLTVKNPLAPFAIGGAISKQLTAKQNKQIQESLLSLQKAHPKDSSNLSQAEAEQALVQQLNILSVKEKELSDRGFERAAAAAETLTNNIRRALRVFLAKKKDAKAFQEFRLTCEREINNARPELEKFRGWGEILINVGLAVAGLGVLYLMAGLVNKAFTGNFLFFAKTDSAQKLDLLETDINQLRASV